VSFRNRPAFRALVLGAALIAAIVAAYAISLRGDFLWDDNLHITENPTIIGPLGLKEIWTTARAHYFPLVLTNFWTQHALWGLEPLGYRLVTLAFHLAAAVLLWRVLLRLRVPGAWLGAALWALHPVQVESVAWICELKNTQSAAFFLAATLCWLRWLDVGASNDPLSLLSPRSTEKRRATRVYLAALAFALLAILSKPSTVMLPVALGLCVWWLRGRIEWRAAFRLVPFFALSAIAAGWTIWEQKFNSGAIGEAWSQTMPERLAIAGRVIWFYLGKLIWPEPLIFIYPRWEIHGTDPLVYLGLIAAVATMVVLWRGRDGRLRPLFFAGVYFVALLFPVLGFFSVYFFRYSFVGDHFQYLASMGPLALAGAALTRLPRRLPIIIGAAVTLALGLSTARHTRVFLGNEALWRHTVAHNPAAVMAWLNLADHLAQSGRHEEAIATFQHALTLKPDDPYGWNDLACVLVLVGRPAEAVSGFERALALKSDFPEAYTNFGNALRDLGRLEEAIVHHRRAVELDPAYPEGHNNLGVALAQAGRSQESIVHFEQALALRPGDAATYDNLGNALRDLGRYEEAMARHQEALRLKPAMAEAHANLGRTLFAAGQAPASLPHFARALELQPGLHAFRSNYASALVSAGRGEEGFTQLQLAVQLAPESADAHVNYGSALAQRGQIEDAITHFRLAIARAPEFGGAHENLGTALATQRRWMAARESFETAVRLNPDSPLARTQLAITLVNEGRLADSVPHFEAALRLQPGSAELHDNFGQVLRALGRNRDAFEHMEEAARLRREKR
jgi:tetratricopeptide (TPR) repeat protein